MQQPLDSSSDALSRVVDEVLHYMWDPIGISKFPYARDEYRAYAPTVIGLLRAGRPAVDVAAYLGSVTNDRMGLGRNAEHDLEVSEVLVEWRRYLNEYNADFNVPR